MSRNLAIKNNLIFRANMATKDAVTAWGSPTGTATNVTFANGAADFSTIDSHLDYVTPSNTSLNVGCIRVRAKRQATTVNCLLYYEDNGTEMHSAIYLSVNATALTLAFTAANGAGLAGFPDTWDSSGAWPADTNYHEVEIDYDLNVGDIYWFMDGTLIKKFTGNAPRVGPITMQRIGLDRSGGVDFHKGVIVDDVKVFSAMQHTSDYTPS